MRRLMYVWDAAAAVGSGHRQPAQRPHPQDRASTRGRGARQRQWRDHRRDLRADFRRAFGEEPGDPAVAVAVMTDADNTKSLARAWYGPIKVGP
jgi:hypothetical protein